MWRHGLTPGFELMGNPGNLWTDFASGKQVSLLMFLAATVQFLAGYQHIIHDVYIMYKNKWCVMVNTCKEFETLPVSQGDVLVRGPSRPVRGGAPDGPGGALFY